MRGSAAFERIHGFGQLAQRICAVLEQHNDARERRSADLLKSFLMGDDLRRWHVESDDLWLIYSPKQRVNIEEYPAIRDYLAPFRKSLQERATKQEWWELQQAQAAYELSFNTNKVIYPHFNDRPNFSFDNLNFYSNDKSYIIPTEQNGLVAYLNAKALWFFLTGLAPAVRGGFCEARVHYMKELPIDFEQTPFAELEASARSASAERFEIVRNVAHRLADLGAPEKSFWGWPDFDFAALRTRLAKRFKIEIPVGERDEWEQYFGDRKLEVQRLSDRIADVETEVNERVYRLFDLERDEVALIEEEIGGRY